MSVVVSGRSGLTNAYRSVLSATGSFEMPGASRWDDMSCLRRRLSGDAKEARDEGRIVVDDLRPADEDRDLAGRGIADVGDDVAPQRAQVCGVGLGSRGHGSSSATG